MNKLVKAGRIMYATGIIGLGVLCIIFKDFIAGRPPAWPAQIDIGLPTSYLTAVVLFVAAIAILLGKKGGPAALVITAMILLLSLPRHLFHFWDDWPNTYKTVALIGGSLIVAASFFKEKSDRLSSRRSGNNYIAPLIITGCIMMASFFIASGYAHFKFAAFVKDFIPAYIPFHVFWTYFCGVCLLAGAAGLLFPPTRRLAALLSGIMISGWFVLLHIPRFFMNMNDASDRMGLCESFAFAGICFVLAGTLSRKR